MEHPEHPGHPVRHAVRDPPRLSRVQRPEAGCAGGHVPGAANGADKISKCRVSNEKWGETRGRRPRRMLDLEAVTNVLAG